MLGPGEVLKAGVCVWLALIAAIIAYRLITGAISTDGLVRTRVDKAIDPERIQMLLLTVAATGYYAWVSLFPLAADDVRQLPDVPDVLLMLLGGSQFLYLSGKVARKIP